MWCPQEKNQPQSCLVTKLDETNLWHRKLGHLNIRSIRKFVSENFVIGLPNLKIEERNVCGECQIGNQTKISHNNV